MRFAKNAFGKHNKPLIIKRLPNVFFHFFESDFHFLTQTDICETFLPTEKHQKSLHH